MGKFPKTSVVTKIGSVTNTKLVVVTLLALAAGATAFILLPTLSKNKSTMFVATTKCFDSDEQTQPQNVGRNIYVSGVVTQTDLKSNILAQKTDSCLAKIGGGSWGVTEYYCTFDKQIASINVPCPDGYSCKNGACQKGNYYCSDSDGGLNFALAGMTTRKFSSGVIGTASDYCMNMKNGTAIKATSGSILNESYCYGDEMLYYPVNCGSVISNGVCKNGACVSK